MSDRDKAGRIERCQSPVRQPSVLEAAAGKNNRCLSDSGGNVGNGKGKAIMKLRRHPANRHAGADISHHIGNHWLPVENEDAVFIVNVKGIATSIVVIPAEAGIRRCLDASDISIVR